MSSASVIPLAPPTYALMAKLVTFLPIGSIALRVNLCSALFGALTVSPLCFLLYEILAGTSLWIRLCAAWSGALFLCVSESFWRFAEVAEVYALHDCLIIILFTVLLKARIAQTLAPSVLTEVVLAFCVPVWPEYWCACHHGFLCPGLSRLHLAHRVAHVPGQGAGVWYGFFFGLGLAVYLYLPFRSLADPVFNAG